MRKALVIIVAVALLGILAAYARPAGGNSASTAAGTSQTADTANTSSALDASASGIGTTSQSNSSADSTSAPSSLPTASLHDGTYKGADIQNRYGDVQASVTISGGKITAVTFEQLNANDQHSEQINSYASAKLVAQTITAQSADIAGVSGATYTSSSYMKSLQSALDKAQV